jgi:TPR repeat protein
MLACFLRFSQFVSQRPITTWVRLAPLVGALVCAASATAEPRQDTERAQASLREGDLITAIALLRKAATEGYAPAQALLGDILDKSEQDAEAVEFYRKAAEQGDPGGQYGLSRMLASGEGVARDPQQALVWLRKAAEQDHIAAVETLARAHRDGSYGLTRDLQEAARLEKHARALGEKAKR